MKRENTLFRKEEVGKFMWFSGTLESRVWICYTFRSKRSNTRGIHLNSLVQKKDTDTLFGNRKQNVSVDMDIHPCGCISIIDLFTHSPIFPLLAFDPEFLYWIFLLNRPPSLPSHTQILALSVTLQQQWLQLDRYFFGLRMTCNMSYIMYYNPYSLRSARPFVLFYVCHNLRVFSSFFLPWFVSSNHFQLNKVLSLFDNGCSSKYIIVISKV